MATGEVKVDVCYGANLEPVWESRHPLVDKHQRTKCSPDRANAADPLIGETQADEHMWLPSDLHKYTFGLYPLISPLNRSRSGDGFVSR